MLGADLPPVRVQIKQAKSFAGRLLEFPEMGPPSLEDARLAIAKPATDEGVDVNSDRVEQSIAETRCYPDFLQEWGKQVWEVAEISPIKLSDVIVVSQRGLVIIQGYKASGNHLHPATLSAVDLGLYQVSVCRSTTPLGPSRARCGDSLSL